jgi:hypothetical protein
LSRIQNDILKTLSYFDIFSYPLTAEELFLYRGTDFSENDLKYELTNLKEAKLIYQNKIFYSLHNDPELISRRINGNLRAAKQLKIAGRSARLLSHFPYVKGIAVSGSLSKNFSTEKDDIDFFIITSANRLWIARSFLHLFLKFVYLLGKQKWFCLNYYVDETALIIPEQNVFTAVEIVTLKPFYGNGVFDQFAASNDWTKKYFPGINSDNKISSRSDNGFLKKLIEKIFNGKFGERLDDWLMKKTARRWQKKVKRMEMNEHGIRLSMLVDKHFAKPDPQFLQTKALEIYDRNIEYLRKKEKPMLESNSATPP